MPCVVKYSKRYTARNSPPIPANECNINKRARGNDGKMYKISADKNGTQRWVKAASKASGKNSKRCDSGKVLNPSSGRCVNAVGRIGRSLCETGTVRNPSSGRCVKMRKKPAQSPDKGSKKMDGIDESSLHDVLRFVNDKYKLTKHAAILVKRLLESIIPHITKVKPSISDFMSIKYMREHRYRNILKVNRGNAKHLEYFAMELLELSVNNSNADRGDDFVRPDDVNKVFVYDEELKTLFDLAKKDKRV